MLVNVNLNNLGLENSSLHMDEVTGSLLKSRRRGTRKGHEEAFWALIRLSLLIW